MQTGTRSRWKRALWIVVPTLALGLAVLPRALAWGGHRHARASSPEELAEHMEHGLEHLLDKLDASDAQREQASALAARRAPALYAIMSEGRAVRQQLKQVLLAEQLDQARLDALRKQLDGLADRATDIGLGGMFELATVLTPAQRKELADHLARFER